MQLKNTKGKTPVLEICAIKVVLDIKKFLSDQVELVNGETIDIDSVRGKLATCYWIPPQCPFLASGKKEGEFFSKNSFPKAPFPNGWQGNSGGSMQLGSLGGLSGASSDTMRIEKILANSG